MTSNTTSAPDTNVEKRDIATVLIANRGEIAVRVMRTLRRMGIRSVAVYTDADASALHVREADVAINLDRLDVARGDASAPVRTNYLSIPAVIEACRISGADGVHPGYGFLSENTAFAAACEEAGIAFLGPGSRAIETMGDKITAKTAVSAFDVPVVPGLARPGLSDDELVAAASEVGFPVLIKPSAGGGGKGMHVVERAEDMADAVARARREAASSFGDDTLFLERFVLRPRHIEVQVIADKHGNVVHLGERECSLQRRHQKVIEEAPSPLLDDATRARIGEAACNTARSVDYVGAGTVEFIVSADAPDEFFFMEMNTRLQVEHPVTELVTGLDLVEWQVRVAAGEPLGFTQDDVTLTGHAIEARVYAEDPARGFLPTGGEVISLSEPTGAGVRVDSGLRVGTIVGSNFDPMLSKVIAYGPDRASALRGLDAALAKTHIGGVVTNIDFCRFLLADPDVVAGRLDTGLLDARVADYVATPAPDGVLVAAASASLGLAGGGDLWAGRDGWRTGHNSPRRARFAVTDPSEDASGIVEVALVHHRDGDDVTISRDVPASVTAARGDGETTRLAVVIEGEETDGTTRFVIDADGERRTYRTAISSDKSGTRTVWVDSPDGTFSLKEAPHVSLRSSAAASAGGDITSPMPGAVIAVQVADGAEVSAGDVVVIVEAMKMEHSLTAPIDGTVEILAPAGTQVAVDEVLARITPPDAS